MQECLICYQKQRLH
jgi:hypothetical protein